jgi:hypothetical protein
VIPRLITAWEYEQGQKAAMLWAQGKNTKEIALALRGKSESWVYNRLEIIKRLACPSQQ